MRTSVLVLGLLLATGMGLAEEKSADSKKDPSLEEMRSLMERTTIEVFQKEAEPRTGKLRDTPVFRYSDEPKFIRDSTLWIWEEKGRPVAIQKIENNFYSAKNPTWTYCFASLSEDFVRFKWPNAAAVETSKAGVVFERIPDGPAPAAEKAARDRQFREMARMFTVKSFTKPDDYRENFRLLPKPIHEYEAKESGILAGKIFGMASGTNPDTLLLIELHEPRAGEVQWRYAPVQMTSIGVSMFLGERKVWTGDPTPPRTFTNWGYFFLPR